MVAWRARALWRCLQQAWRVGLAAGVGLLGAERYVTAERAEHGGCLALFALAGRRAFGLSLDRSHGALLARGGRCRGGGGGQRALVTNHSCWGLLLLLLDSFDVACLAHRLVGCLLRGADWCER